MGAIEIDPLEPSGLAGVDQKLHSHLSVELVASAFLALTGCLKVVVDGAVSLACAGVGHCSIKHHAVVEVDSHGNHGLLHGGIPVAIGSGIEIFDEGIPELAQHLLELILIFLGPAIPSVSEEFGGDDEGESCHPDEKPGIMLGDGLEGGGPSVEDFGGEFGSRFFSG